MRLRAKRAGGSGFGRRGSGDGEPEVENR